MHQVHVFYREQEKEQDLSSLYVDIFLFVKMDLKWNKSDQNPLLKGRISKNKCLILDKCDTASAGFPYL